MKSCFGNNRQGRCACNACMAVRFPKLCTRCGSTSHYAEDCTRMPAADQLDARTHELTALIQALAVILGALILFSYLERVPT